MNEEPLQAASEAVQPATVELAGTPEYTPRELPAIEGKRVLTLKQAHTGWKCFRQFTEHDSLEVFVSPNGHHYRMVKTLAEADVVAPSKTKGLGPLYLASIDHWVSGEG
jgi:hypothetical protein